MRRMAVVAVLVLAARAASAHAVEAEILPQRVERRRVGVTLDHTRGDVGRHEPHHREHDHAHQEERRDREGDAVEDVALH